METSNPNSTSRADRKTIEKNRRNQMKALYSNLDSLVPRQPISSSSSSREAVSLPDRVLEATKYIKKLQINLEKLKERKDRLVPQVVGTNYQTSNNVVDHDNTSLMGGGGGGGSGGGGGLRSVVPQLDIHEINGDGSNILDVVLITGLDTKFLLNQTMRVIHQEGADIINTSYSLVHDTLFHTIRSKVGDSSIAARISERLNRLVQDTTVKLQCNNTKIQERIVTTDENGFFVIKARKVNIFQPVTCKTSLPDSPSSTCTTPIFLPGKPVLNALPPFTGNIPRLRR